VKRNQLKGSTAAEIAASVERSVHAGGQGGGQLPTIRELAATLRVSPVTVAAAYRLLQTRGLTVGHGRRGTRLRPSELAHARLGTFGGSARQAQAARATSIADGVVDLATGNPDPGLLPPIDVALRTVDTSPHFYGEPLELRPLIAFATAEFEADGIPVGAVTVTSGALDAVERVLREHLRAGDSVAVEDPTLPALLDLLGSLGLTPQPCAVDDDGPEPGAFERALGPQVRAVIVTPRAQNPTGAAIGPRRAVDLARLLRRRPQVVLIEIDPAGPVSGAPAVTLADRAREHWVVVKSTSKFLGPDLRVAVMAGDALTMARVQRRQALGIRWVSHLLQRLTLALWSDPSNGRRLARAAEVYAQRRNALIDALAAHGISAHGRSGFNVWIPVREETATVQALAERGWAVAAGERFRIRSAPAIRVTTSVLAPDEARRFAADFAASVHSPAGAFA